MLHVNQYSTAHTEAAKEFDGIFAQWTMARKKKWQQEIEVVL